MLALARSGLLARLFDLDNVSANLANVNTVGFKSNRVNFQEALASALPVGTGASATQRLMGPGSLRATSNPLDLAIEGDGFFAVRLPDGQTAYTRDGQFKRDANNQIVTDGGFRLVWQGQLPANVEDIHVNPDGTVMVQQNGTWSPAGQIQLARFPNPSALAGYGQNAYLPTDASGAAQTGNAGANSFGQIRGNALESSNVNLSEEMTRLIALQRAYGMSVRAFQQTDQMIGLAIQMRRG